MVNLTPVSANGFLGRDERPCERLAVDGSDGLRPGLVARFGAPGSHPPAAIPQQAARGRLRPVACDRTACKREVRPLILQKDALRRLRRGQRP